jgi:hypothetical protein
LRNNQFYCSRLAEVILPEAILAGKEALWYSREPVILQNLDGPDIEEWNQHVAVCLEVLIMNNDSAAGR